jgi:hypothetical protein
MKDILIYCLSIKTNILNFIKKLNYIPVGLGDENFSNEWLRDNTGDNITNKNKFYSEYTFHYWLWKNMLDKIPESKWIGFSGYRRFWANSNNIHSDEISKIIKKDNFNNFVLKKINPLWNNYDVVLGEEMYLGEKIKLFKLIKNGGIGSLTSNFRSYLNNHINIKFHFDVFHGNKILAKAITLLEPCERKDFNDYVLLKNSFNRGNIFICNSKNIIHKYYNSVMPWLERCEKEFGLNENWGYNKRIYGFLGERYLPYWFNKYYKCIEWPVFFYDPTKDYNL